MDAKLKALKVADLKAIIAAAGVSLPSKANKADLIALILASEPALEAYHALHGFEQSEPVTKAEAKPPAKPVAEKPKSAARAPVKEQPAPPAVPVPAPVPATTQAAVSSPSTAVAPATESSVDPLDSEEAKRKMRAERFGIPLVDPSSIIKPTPKRKRVAPSTGDDAEKIQKRAERFGTTQKAEKAATKRKQPVEEVVDEEELARRKKRVERFGPVKS